MAVATTTIRGLLQRVNDGEVRIPAFQREYVWEPDRVQFLMDSIYKQYPIGTVLFWRTREKLNFDRDLGPYTLPAPKADYPIDYVLDGQQRLTSIFSTFQTELKKNPTTQTNWVDIYFDLNANENAQDSQFLALKDDEVEKHHVPLNILFDVTEYGKFTRQVTDEVELAKIDLLQTRFKEAQIPIETVETEDHSKIAIIFERVNRGGVPLDTYQLLSAWTWSGDFDLRTKFEDLALELDEYGFSDLKDEPDLLLKCCSGLIKGDSSSKSIIDLKGTEVRDNFDLFRNAFLGAIDFLRRDCGVISLKILPYKSMIIPLVKFFSSDKTSGYHPNVTQRKALVKWFWNSLFDRRYSNSVDTAVSNDFNAFALLKKNDSSLIDKRTVTVTPEFFTQNQFSMNAVNTKTFILLLANSKPKSFISGASVDLGNVLMSCNRTEFHHIFPKNYLKTSFGIDKEKSFVLANFAFLSQTDNRQIQDKAPSEYKSLMAVSNINEILEAAFIPESGLDLVYDDFISSRASLLSEKANKLAN